MLEKRVIPCLLLEDGGFVKTVKFKNQKYIGDPINTVKIFNEKEVDEIFIFDIEASRLNKEPDFSLLSQIAEESFIPLGYGGGIKSIDTMKKLFNLGFEKLSLNTSIQKSFNLLKEATQYFGNQSIVATVDIERTLLRGCFIYSHHQKKRISQKPIEYIKKLEASGVGEICLNFVCKDGTMSGYDLDFIEDVVKSCKVPVIALGGAASLDDFKVCLKKGVQAVGAGSFFIYHGPHKAVLINYPLRSKIEEIIKGD